MHKKIASQAETIAHEILLSVHQRYLDMQSNPQEWLKTVPLPPSLSNIPGVRQGQIEDAIVAAFEPILDHWFRSAIQSKIPNLSNNKIDKCIEMLKLEMSNVPQYATDYVDFIQNMRTHITANLTQPASLT